MTKQSILDERGKFHKNSIPILMGELLAPPAPPAPAAPPAPPAPPAPHFVFLITL